MGDPAESHGVIEGFEMIVITSSMLGFPHNRLIRSYTSISRDRIIQAMSDFMKTRGEIFCK